MKVKEAQEIQDKKYNKSNHPNRRETDNTLFGKMKRFLFPKKQKVTDYFQKPTLSEVNGEPNCVCFDGCGVTYYCDSCFKLDFCKWVKKDIEYDPNKPSILIIDDNIGMVSFLRDDVESILEKKRIYPSEYNILEFSSNLAVYQFIATHRYYGGMNIAYAIIDITFGGTVLTANGNIRLTGVDVLKEIYNTNRELKFLFYTGNVLNHYIKSNAELINQFKEIYADDISNYVLFKTTLTMDERQKEIEDRLFE